MRHWLLVLGIVLSLSIAACGTGETTAEDGTDSTESVDEDGPTLSELLGGWIQTGRAVSGSTGDSVARRRPGSRPMRIPVPSPRKLPI